MTTVIYFKGRDWLKASKMTSLLVYFQACDWWRGVTITLVVYFKARDWWRVSMHGDVIASFYFPQALESP